MDPKYRSELRKSIAHAVIALAVPWAPTVWILLLDKGASVRNMTLGSYAWSFAGFFGPLLPLIAVVATVTWVLVWPRKLRRLNEGRLSIGVRALQGLLWILLVLEALGLAASVLFFRAISGG